MLTLLLALATLFQRWTARTDDSTDDHDLAGDEDDSGDDDELGDGGLSALRKERSDRKQAEREARRARKAQEAAEKALADLQASQQTDDEKRVTEAVAQARLEAAEEARAKYVGRATSAEVRAAAAGKGFINPEDAERLLDLDDDLDPDAEDFRGTIAAALDALAEERPYLIGEAKPRVTGNGDGGAKPKPSTSAENISPSERLRRAYGNKK